MNTKHYYELGAQAAYEDLVKEAGAGQFLGNMAGRGVNMARNVIGGVRGAVSRTGGGIANAVRGFGQDAAQAYRAAMPQGPKVVMQQSAQPAKVSLKQAPYSVSEFNGAASTFTSKKPVDLKYQASSRRPARGKPVRGKNGRMQKGQIQQPAPVGPQIVGEGYGNVVVGNTRPSGGKGSKAGRSYRTTYQYPGVPEPTPAAPFERTRARAASGGEPMYSHTVTQQGRVLDPAQTGKVVPAQAPTVSAEAAAPVQATAPAAAAAENVPFYKDPMTMGLLGLGGLGFGAYHMMKGDDAPRPNPYMMNPGYQQMMPRGPYYQ